LIYSTCTFNTKENEENIRWMLSEYDAEVVNIEIKPEWNITGSLLGGFTEPVYRFIPGISQGEGLFMCVLRKGGTATKRQGSPRNADALKVISPARNSVPSYPQTELTYQQAMAYLRHEALVLSPDVPRGIVTVCFRGQPLGEAKNIGTRANNLYPKEWKIKTTHIPTDYEAILRHTEPHPDGGHSEG
ncbi:MAG: hypothetical protein K2O48_00215, partial [Prevotella sp.]|nr:hypothetical protein [Prevotella sp.]